MSFEIVSTTPSSGRGASTPRPGQIFDPVARALDMVGGRWTLVLARHLLSGPKGFQELRLLTGISPRQLSSRLRQLRADGFVAAGHEGSRSLHTLTDRGRSLEPIIAAIVRWWVRHGIPNLEPDAEDCTVTSPRSILALLPFLLREERAGGTDVTFEIRLTGDGGGVWAVRIADGACTVRSGSAAGADVRYTADARVWCGVALGLVGAREAMKRGLMIKEGGRAAMDRYFHQIARPPDSSARPDAGGRGSTAQRSAM